MKTLIINGSPKKKGDTTALIDELVRNLTGEVRILSSFSHISPCTDCRYCWNHSGCRIADEMQEIYPYLDACDNIVLASPIWFSSLSGPLLDIVSRMQTLFAARHFRHEHKETKQKNGVLIMVGAEKGTEEMPTKNALTMMNLMNVRRPCIATIYSLDTDHVPAVEDETALKGAREAAIMLNHLYNNSPVK